MKRILDLQAFAPIPTTTPLLALDSIKISPLTVDNASTLTYGTAIDVPGAIAFAFEPQVTNKILRAANKIRDVYSKIDQTVVNFTHAEVSLDVLKALFGGAVVSSGTTPNQKQTYTLLNTDRPTYFKIEGRLVYGDGVGDCHVVLYKCKLTSYKWEGQDDQGDYAKPQGALIAFGTTKDSKVVEVIFNETAAAIAD